MNANPYTLIGKERASGHIILCDHATNIVPDCVGGGCLGLPQSDMERHIAFDIGALGVAQFLGEFLDGPVLHTRFSRLVIDPNRSEDDPTTLMRLYDGSLIPANRYADAAEKERRLAKFHRPYHNAVAELVAQTQAPIITSVHSFTPQLNGRPPRPWQVGILYNRDQRLSDPLIASLSTESDLTIGANEPYTGALEGDTMERHALTHGHLHVLLEIRNDLIETPAQQRAWAERLTPHIEAAVQTARG